MSIFKKQSKNNSPRNYKPISSTKSAPVMHYYRPTIKSGNLQPTENKKTEAERRTMPGVESRLSLKNFKSKVKRHADSMSSLEKILVLVIIFVLAANLLTIGVSLDLGKTKENEVFLYRSEADYRKLVNSRFNSSLLFHFKPTFSAQDFSDNLTSKMPEIIGVEVGAPPLGNKLKAKLKLAEPLGVLVTYDVNQKLVLSSNGYSIDFSGDPAQLSGLPEVTITGAKIDSQAQVLTAEESHLLTLLSNELDGSSPDRPPIKGITVDINKQTIQVRLSEKNYHVKLSPQESAERQVGALISTLKSINNQQSVAPNNYIDVRVEGRVYIN